MKLSGRQPLILASIVALLGMGLYLLLVLHPSQKRSTWRLKRQEASLSSELTRTQRELEAQRQFLSELVAWSPAIHYPPGPGRPGEHTPRIVESVAQAANACRVDILSLGPGIAKETAHFVEYAIPVKLSGEYGQLLQLVSGLERTLGLRLFQVALRSGLTSQEGRRRELSFILNAYEIKGDAPLAPPQEILGEADLPPLPFSGAAWQGGRDPFQAVSKASPVVYSEATRTDRADPVYQLSGILNFGGRLKAIVNDRMVEEGDRIQDSRVIAITGDSVTFLYRGKPLTVRFKPIFLNDHGAVK